MAVWMPTTVVPTSLATVAIETFITELSNVIRNWPDANVTRTIPAPVARRSAVSATRFHHPIHPASHAQAKKHRAHMIADHRGSPAHPVPVTPTTSRVA